MRVYRCVLLAFVTLGCHGGGSARVGASHADRDWPRPDLFQRAEPLPGVSLLVPPLSPAQVAEVHEANVPPCKDIQPLGWPPRATRGCRWYAERRYLGVLWFPEAFEPNFSANEKLEFLRRTFELKSGHEQDLRRLPDPWLGWEWTTRAQGDLIRDRFVVFGSGFLLLQAVSHETDPFAESEVFLDSLRLARTPPGW